VIPPAYLAATRSAYDTVAVRDPGPREQTPQAYLLARRL
jgi:hypothetical protein